jgi:hypothetical protein
LETEHEKNNGKENRKNKRLMICNPYKNVTIIFLYKKF